MTDLSDCQPAYSHVEEAIKRAYATPRGNFGKMMSDNVYDGLNANDKMVQDSMVKRICQTECALICLDLFQLCYDDTVDNNELSNIITRLMGGVVPPDVGREFTLECFERWSKRRLCNWRRMTIAQRSSSTGVPKSTLEKQSSNIRKLFNEIQQAGFMTVRFKLEDMGLL